MADFLAALLMLPLLVHYRSSLLKSLAGLRPLAPLLALIAYAGLQAWQLHHIDDASIHYALELSLGLLPYALFYLLFRHLAPHESPLLLVVLLVVPGLVHLAYLYFDIVLAIARNGIEFSTSSKQGLIEYVKNVPRVGRRYLSVALLHLFGGGVLMAWCAKKHSIQYAGGLIAGMCMLSLALLDARTAYVSMAIGAILLILALGPKKVGAAFKGFLRIHPVWKFSLAVFLLVVFSVGFSAGKSRWIAMSYSFNMAEQDVFHVDAPLPQRPYVDMEFWSAPIADVDECYLSGRFRCRADQSAYLRMAWLLEGIQSLIMHPVGIGYSHDYMGRLWGVEGDPTKYQHIDSFLVEHAVSFGWPALLMYGWFFACIVFALRQAVRTGRASAALFVACAIVLTCAGRMLVDVFSEGLWRYLMAMTGIFYGLLHARALPAEEE